MLVLRINLAILVLLHTGCIAAAALPPSRTDLSPMMVARHGRVDHGSRLSSGVHWASATVSEDVAMDIGAGAIYERGQAAASESRSAELVTKAAEPVPAPTQRVGAYVEVSTRLHAQGQSRTWVGGRGELLYDSDGRLAAMGFSGRLSWEMFAPGAGAGGFSDPKAFLVYAAYGTFAIGSHLDIGVQRDIDGQVAFLALAGVSLRLPALAFLGAASK